MRGYHPISDYALIGDGHAAGLVASDGSIDWCCLPRLDDASCFGRLLDERRGGFCSVEPESPAGEPTRGYREDTLVLETIHAAADGRVRVLDLLPIDAGDPAQARRQVLRVIDGLSGATRIRIRIAPRFDYGEAAPWLRRVPGGGGWYAIAGDDALLIGCDAELEPEGDRDLTAIVELEAGERARLSMTHIRPEEIDRDDPRPPSAAEVDHLLEETVTYWREWASQARLPDVDRDGVLRSALILRALHNPRTGAVAAAATTSLPEAAVAGRTWDYRYAWVRDSAFAVRSLAELGFTDAADAVRRFVQRSAAGHADELRILYGVGGERRMPEQELDWMEGWRGLGPVRVGNSAAGQRQLDALGQFLDLTWRWHERGESPDDEVWAFIEDVVERAAREWDEPDSGIWEWRGNPRHFVHSKAMCWVALDRGIRLAEDTGRCAPLERWRAVRDDIHATVTALGVDREHGVFVQAFGVDDLDAAVLRLPSVGFVAWDDERMLQTVRAIRDRLGDDGLIRRYDTDDGLPGREGAFISCAFWLAECLARQGRGDEAREVFDRALETRNDVPQALTHFSHIEAALAVHERTASPDPVPSAG